MTALQSSFFAHLYFVQNNAVVVKNFFKHAVKCIYIRPAVGSFITGNQHIINIVFFKQVKIFGRPPEHSGNFTFAPGGINAVIIQKRIAAAYNIAACQGCYFVIVAGIGKKNSIFSGVVFHIFN